MGIPNTRIQNLPFSGNNNMNKEDLLELINSFPDDTQFFVRSVDHEKRVHPIRSCGQGIITSDYSAGFGVYKWAVPPDSSAPENKLVAIFY